MKKDPKQEAWIPLVDYLERGVRKEKVRVDPFATRRYRHFPATWVPLEDAMVRGMHKQQQVSDETLIQRIKPLPPKQQVPPEAYQTIFHALQAIWAMPRPTGAVFVRLKAMHAADQAEWAAGRLSTGEFNRRTQALATIRADYAGRAEAVGNWFLENGFRLFDTLPNAL